MSNESDKRSVAEGLKRFWPFGKKSRVKTPTVLQMETVECGAAALGIVLAYFGRYVPLEELRIACGVSRDGSKASNVLKAAREYGLQPTGFRQLAKNLRNFRMPMIIHWRFSHFLVVEGFDGDTVYLNDPATGPRTISMDELEASFSGVAFIFEPGEKFEKGGKKPTVFDVLRPRLAGSESALTFVLLASLALIIPGLLIPTFVRVFVDFYLIQGLESWLWPLLITMGFFGILQMALTWMQQGHLLRLETKLAITNSSRLIWHLLRLPAEFFTQRSAGEISSRNNMNDRVAMLLSSQLATTLLNVIMLVFFVILMIQYSLVLTAVGVVIAGLNILVLRYMARTQSDANKKLLREQGQLIATTSSGLQNIETIKATAAESDFFSKLVGYQAKVTMASQEFRLSRQITSTVSPAFLSTIAIVAILAFGGLDVINGRLTIGMLIAFQALMISFLAPVNSLVGMGAQLQEVDGILLRLEDVFRYPVDDQVRIVDMDQARISEEAKLTGTLELRNVSFGYSRLEAPLIEDFNLVLKPGSRVALVGSSGSGKSTVSKLVTGLYKPWSGEILFDGIPRNEVHRPLLNASLSFVDQDIFLFEGTVRENLTMWDDDVPEEDVIQAAKDAHIHETITDRPGGYNALIEEGGRNFSGGQRQRLEIARSLACNPSLLVLDEATSALDPVTEHIIDDNLRRRGCSCLVVAHRLSTIRDCDEIIVLDKGKVVERGSHDELWRKRGAYFNLIRAEAPESEMVLDTLLEALYE